MQNKTTQTRQLFYYYLIAILAGIILFFAFAPHGIYPLAIISPALLLFSWSKLNARQALFSGWLFGISFFGFGASWIYISLHNYGFMPIPLASLVTAIFVAFLALFPALQGYYLNKLFPENNYKKILLTFPILWVVSEWIRSWLLTGFPWLFVGYTQIDSPLRGIAPIVGVYGISFAVTFTAAILVYILLIKSIKQRILLCVIALALWFLSGMLNNINWTKPVGSPINVSLVQGNIAQEIKWQPEKTPAILQQYYAQTAKNWSNKIIVWPEAAIPSFPENLPGFLDKLDTAATKHNTTIISGIPLLKINDNSETKYYNGLISLGINHHQQYLKRNLVPFGEYIPLPWLLNWLLDYLTIPMSNFSSGPNKQEPILAANTIIAPFICYEITYPDLLLDYLPKAQLLLTISDDSWFGKSVAAAQHVEIARMRSAESGRYQMISTNNAITAIVDDHGRIIKQALPYQQTVLNGEVQAMNGMTPFASYGHYFWLIMFLGIGVLIVERKK